jgi:AraC-like DNA-binding protein
MDKNFLTDLIDKSEISLNNSGNGKHLKDSKVTITFQDFDVFHTLSGSYTLIINHKKYIANPRDSFLMTPNSTLTLIANEDSKQLFYHFSVVYAGKMNLTGDFEDYKLPPKQSALMKLFRKYFEDCTHHKLVSLTALKSVFKIVLLEMVFLSEGNFNKFISKSPYPFNSQFLDVIRYIQNNPDIPIKNSFLAEMAGFNQCYFSRYFKKVMGISASDYICNIKMNAAKQLLIDKKVSINEAAMELGFSDQFIFSRKFKKHFGVSPNQFKKINI